MNKIILSVLLSLCTTWVCAQQNNSTTPIKIGETVMDKNLNIIQNISKTRDHTVFIAVIKAAGLLETLKGAGPFTVFAATGDAFIHKMPAGTVEVMFDELLPKQQPELNKIMSYNILKGSYTTKDLSDLVDKGNGTATINTLSGPQVTLKKDNAGNILLIDENNRTATISVADIPQKNGIVHVTNEVLLPKNEFFSKEYTLYPSGKKPIEAIKHTHPYHQTLTLTLGVAFAPYDGNSRRRDNGPTQVRYTFEQALEVIKELDKNTFGIPKIIFLVGWQYEGHDSKYPAFFEGNEALKRPQDKNALESLKWLMAEGKKYNTTVSLHINFTDAYEDSPLWDDYLKHDIIGRLEGGHIRKAVGWGYPISYVQELKTGYFQKRIDKLFEILPLKEAGVVHVDAFHTYNPLDPRGPMSPYLGYTVEQEEEAQKQMFDYVASKGANVTSEFVHEFRDHGLEGYQPFAWHFRITAQEYLDWPASYYTGALDKTDLGIVFGTSFQGINFPQLKKNFSTKTLPWYFLNRLDRKSYTHNKDFQSADFSGNVESRLGTDRKYTLKQDGNLLMENEDVFIPAQWIDGKNIIAYSGNGYKNKTWTLPKDWDGVKKVTIYEMGPNGLVEVSTKNISKNQISLTLKSDQQLLLKAQ